uniref:Putative ovule protein n=1 Tax=Solanum chacoense TaxID=4108 RepID=A0A0V0GTU3_SOLCH
MKIPMTITSSTFQSFKCTFSTTRHKLTTSVSNISTNISSMIFQTLTVLCSCCSSSSLVKFIRSSGVWCSAITWRCTTTSTAGYR